MVQTNLQKKLAFWLVTVSVGTTLCVAPTVSLDPINLPKFFFLLASTGAIIGILVSNLKNILLQSNKFVLIFLGIFIGWMSLNFVFARSNFEQQLFGTYGRNTGFLTYLCFAIVMLAAVNSDKIFLREKFVIGVIISIAINLSYGFLQYLGIDPFNWAKLYSPIIGTFGNPNFYSAFLGMVIAFLFPYLFSSKIGTKFKIMIFLSSLLSIFLIHKSDSQQGFLVIAGSIGLIFYFIIKFNYKKVIYSRIYSILYASSGTLVILGLLQKGPLSNLIYEPSITYRGDYWRSGIRMMEQFPMFGVGLDSFGNWYRAFRTSSAISRRGPSAVTDAAHNVFIDIGATAGVIALITYLFLIFYCFYRIFKYLNSSKIFDPYFLGLVSMWIAYLIQASISINNLALGIWGWLIPGMILSITKENNIVDSDSRPKTPSKNLKGIDFSGMTITAGIVIFGILGFIPFNADANFRHALENASEEKIISAATKWPLDTSRMLYAVQVFSDNNLSSQATQLARKVTNYNRFSFNAWMYLYEANTSNLAQKRKIKSILIKLDPNNLELKRLP